MSNQSAESVLGSLFVTGLDRTAIDSVEAVPMPPSHAGALAEVLTAARSGGRQYMQAAQSFADLVAATAAMGQGDSDMLSLEDFTERLGGDGATRQQRSEVTKLFHALVRSELNNPSGIYVMCSNCLFEDRVTCEHCRMYIYAPRGAKTHLLISRDWLTKLVSSGDIKQVRGIEEARTRLLRQVLDLEVESN